MHNKENIQNFSNVHTQPSINSFRDCKAALISQCSSGSVVRDNYEKVIDVLEDVIKNLCHKN